VTERQLQDLIGPKFEVIRVLFWYAVRRERCGDADLFGAILNLIKREFYVPRSDEIFRHLSASKMFTHGSPRAVALAGPYIHWGQGQSVDTQGLVSKWVGGISVAPRTKEVARSVVDTLLQIAANPHLRPLIPSDIWSWLNVRPSLPPGCGGLSWGRDRDVIRTVRALGDIEILVSYLILIWSKSRLLDSDGYAEIQISICEDFKGIDMGHHRAELIQRLDSISINQPSAAITEFFWRRTRGQYQEFKRVLQEVDQKATETLNRMPSSFIFLSMLTPVGLYRIIHLHVCPASPVSVTSCLGRLALFEINRVTYSLSIPLLFPCALPVGLEQSQFYLNIYHSECAGRKTCYYVLGFFCLRTYIFYHQVATAIPRCMSSPSIMEQKSLRDQSGTC